MNRTIITLSIFLILVTLMACGSPSAVSTAKPTATTTSGPKYGGVFTMNQVNALAQMGAPADSTAMPQRFIQCVFEPLLVCDSAEKIKPWLAESHQVSPDNKSITLTLRKGIKFTDGTDFNAEAVKFNLELALKNNITGSAVLRKVVSYEIPDPYTIKMNLSGYDATILLSLAQGVIGLMASPTAQQKPTTPDTIAEVHMVGTGPFMFDNWKRDTFVKFKKNPNYWQAGKPYLDGITWNVVTDLTVSLMSFKSGQVNGVITLDPIDAVGLQKEGYTIIQPPFTVIHAIFPDGANADSPFANPKVREALEYAIDKKSMADGVGMGFFKPANQFAAREKLWYDFAIPGRNFDVNKCKQLLKEAGYPDGVKTTLIVQSNIRTDIFTAVQSYLKTAGFDCTIDKADAARFTDLTLKGWKGILMPGTPTPQSLNNYAIRIAPLTYYASMYRPAGWQEKWNAILGEPNEATRIQKLKEMVKLMYDNCVCVPYQEDSTRAVTDKTVRGFADFFQTNNADYYQPAEIWLNK